MPTDYEKVYQQQRHALGNPTKEFVTFFDQYKKRKADVLDIGCGQGRDALFIARQDHHVVGVDISPTGIAQLLEDAQSEGLNIEGIIVDLGQYEPSDEYDVVVIDRTLHMLDVDTRLRVLKQVSRATRNSGFVLIADEKSNMPSIKEFFQTDSYSWTILTDSGSFLCVQKVTILEPT